MINCNEYQHKTASALFEQNKNTEESFYSHKILCE